MKRIKNYLKHLFWRHQWNRQIKSGRGDWIEIEACWQASERYRLSALTGRAKAE